jgi:hypothetical protein
MRPHIANPGMAIALLFIPCHLMDEGKLKMLAG